MSGSQAVHPGVIPPLEEDLYVISKLDDQPNDVGGMTAEELKLAFDEAPNRIKDYINNTMRPYISDTVAEAVQREAAEQGRVSAEQERVLAEQGRVSAERGRVSAEAARVLAEQARADEDAGIVAQAGAKALAAASSASSAAQSSIEAAEAARTAKAYSGKPPIVQGGTWWVWNAAEGRYKDTGSSAAVIEAETMGFFRFRIEDGELILNYADGDNPPDASIDEDGNLLLTYSDKAPARDVGRVVGPPGPQGETPSIGSNGNWWVGGEDTGVPASGGVAVETMGFLSFRVEEGELLMGYADGDHPPAACIDADGHLLLTYSSLAPPQDVGRVVGPQGEPGAGVPAGGAAGQVLSKRSGADFDTLWTDPPAGGGGAAAEGESVPFTIPAAGWEEDELADSRYSWYRDIPVAALRAEDRVDVTVVAGGSEEAVLCGLAPFTEALEGKFRMRAVTRPSTDMAAAYWLFHGR